MSHEEDKIISTSMGEFIKKYEIDGFHYDFIDRLMFIIAAGLGLIAALAWDDVLHSLFGKLFDFLGESLTQLGYAIVLTVLATITALIFKKISKKRRNKRLG